MAQCYAEFAILSAVVTVTTAHTQCACPYSDDHAELGCMANILNI